MRQPQRGDIGEIKRVLATQETQEGIVEHTQTDVILRGGSVAC